MFPSILLNWKGSAENSNQSNHSINDSSTMEGTIMVPTASENVHRASDPDTSTEIDSDIGPQSTESAPTLPQVVSSWVSCVKEMLQEQGISRHELEIILESWRKATKEQ